MQKIKIFNSWKVTFPFANVKANPKKYNLRINLSDTQILISKLQSRGVRNLTAQTSFSAHPLHGKIHPSGGRPDRDVFNHRETAFLHFLLHFSGPKLITAINNTLDTLSEPTFPKKR